nr:CDP-glycerol glycerophosphotransferase family protein [uncultured Methanospirillum sp.]
MKIIRNLTKLEKKIIQKYIFFFVGFFFRIIDSFWPKKGNVIVFGSQMGFSMSGSPKYVYDHILQHKLPYNVYFYLPFREKGVLNQLRYILSFAPVFFKAKILISSHPPYDFIPFSWTRRKVLINTWHGIPLKCMFFSDLSASKADLKEVQRLNGQTNYYLVSSSIEASLITRCFLLDPRKIAFWGHPRNDELSNDSSKKNISKLFPKLPEYSTTILYCPTYRKGVSTRFFPFNDFDIKRFEEFLEQNRIIIFTRGHVQDFGEDKIIQNSRIIELGHDILQEINEILPEIKILITDYSSIFFDYLLLNKPCIFIPYDIKEYKHNVGLLFDNYNYWTPGHKVFTYIEFIKVLEEILSGHDTYKAKREEMKDLFHYYQKGNSSEKILEYLNYISEGNQK